MTSQKNTAGETNASQGPSWTPPAVNTGPRWPDEMIFELAFLYFGSDMSARQLQVVMTASFNVDCEGSAPTGQLIRGKVRMAVNGECKANAAIFEEVVEMIRNGTTAQMNEFRRTSTIDCLEICVKTIENREAVPEEWKNRFLGVSWDDVTIGRNDKRIEEFLENRVHWG